MQDARMLMHLVEGTMEQAEDILDDNDNVGEFPSESGVSNAVLSRWLPSTSSTNMAVSRMVAVSVEVSVPDMSQFKLSGHLPDITSSLQPMEQPILLDLTNSTTLDSNWTSVWSSEEVGAVIIISLMVPFILVSNIIVILCVIRFRRLHTPTNYFITSLAAVDIFVALATPFVVVVEVFRFSHVAAAGDVVLCLLPNRILMMGCGVSVLTLAAIAYDRHTALVSPLKYVNIMTTRRVTVLVLLSWLYSVVIVWLPLMVGWYHVPSVISPCSANLIQGKAPLLFLSAIFVPSCVAIIICYFRILMVARQHVKAIAAFEFAVHRRVRVKCLMRETKCLKTLALIIGVFLVLWLPYLILIFLKTVSSMKFDVWIQTYLILLAVFNSGINPWMYAFMNSDLRAAFKRLFREICHDRFCALDRRRSSVVSAVSSTPRLSLTDSRAVSIVPDPSVDTDIAVCVIPDPSLDLGTEATRRRLELCVERQALPPVCRLRHHDQAQLSEIAAQSLFADWNQPEKQADSCPHLDTVDNSKPHWACSLPRPMSTSFNHDVRERPHLDILDDSDLITHGMYHQISVHTSCGQETPDSLNTATSNIVNATSSPSPSVTSVSLIQSHTPIQPHTPIFPQYEAKLITTLPPSPLPPGCLQIDHHASSPTPISGPTATASSHTRLSDMPQTSSSHTRLSDMPQTSSSHTRLSDMPQTSSSHTRLSDMPQTSSSHTRLSDMPQTSSSHTRLSDMPQTSSSHTRLSDMPQTSSSHTRLSDMPQTSSSHTRLSDMPQTSSSHTRLSDMPQTSSSHTRLSDMPQTSSSHTRLSDRLQTSSSHTRLSDRLQTSSSHTRLSDRPQTHDSGLSTQDPPRTHPHHSCTCPVTHNSHSQAIRQTRDIFTNHRRQPLIKSPHTSAECTPCSFSGSSPPQTSLECRPCSFSGSSPPQTPTQCTNSSIPPLQTSADCSNCSLPPDCSNCSLPPDCINCSLLPDCSNCSLPPDCNNCSLLPDCCNSPLPPPLRPPSRQFCAMFAPVTAYNFLLPLCETLALDVISTAARLETCIDLARLASCEHTMLIH